MEEELRNDDENQEENNNENNSEKENESEDEDEKYKDCLCYGDGKCGPFRKWKKDEIDSVTCFNSNISGHLQSIKLKLPDHVDERALIEDRLQRKLPVDAHLCSYHRYSLGIGWKQPKQCCHPSHHDESKKKGSKTRAIPLQTLKSFNNRNKPLAIGSVFCFTHLQAETKKVKEESADFSVSPVAVSTPTAEKDEEYQPEEITIPEEAITIAAETAMSLCDVLNSSPVPFQIKNQRVSNLSDTTKQKLRQKLTRMKKSLEKTFAEAIAPGQSEELINDLLSPTEKSSDEIPDELKVQVKMYNDTDSLGKLVILSMVNHSKYTKNEIMKIFNCSKYQVDQARKLQAQPVYTIPSKQKNSRCRTPQEKIEHFLEFLFSSGLLQDVAYGINNIKFENGEKVKVSNAILTMRYSHTINYYKQICEETNYTPLSDSSLWRILNGIKPSQRKALAGLDDVTAAAMNAFATLDKVADTVNCKSLQQAMEKGKRYLKSAYPASCSEKSSLKSHSTLFALSDPSDTNLNESESAVSEEESEEFVQLFSCIKELQDAVIKKNDDDLAYDFRVAVDDIQTYIKHQIRDVQQRLAKLAALENLDEDTVFWLKDYCQKVLPSKFREGQKEYFGKKGMTLHVDVLITKVAGELVKKVYFTAAYRSDQGLSDSLCLADVVLDQMKKDFPNVSNIYAKSDNAASYHGNYYLTALFKLCQKKNLRLKRYDYNEPCRGKDQCDRESAGAKSVMRSYIDAGNDITTAEYIFEALHHGSGIQNAKVSVVSIDTKKTTLKGSKTIPKISQYHSFEFFSDHMLMWRYYGIGEGKRWDYADVTFEPKIDVILPFSSTSKVPDTQNSGKSKKPRIDRRVNNLFFCPKRDCCDSFDSKEELEDHLLKESHTIQTKPVSFVDRAKASYVEKMKLSLSSSSFNLTTSSTTSLNNSTASLESSDIFFWQVKGWALPVRKFFRFNAKQKRLLMEVFMKGEETGQKQSPEQTHLWLRQHLPPQEYVTSQQIRALFSRWSKKKREGTLDNATTATEEEIEITECNEAEDDDEINLHSLALKKVAQELSLECDVGDWVAVVYNGEWYPGIVQRICDDKVVVKCMEHTQGKNKFRWPGRDDINEYLVSDVITKLTNTLIPTNSRGDFKIEEREYDSINNKLNKLRH